MALPKEKIKAFRGIGHHLNPIVTISENGITEGVQLELERALNDHELIKVKVSCGDREQKQELIKEMVSSCGCELVQTIGKVALIYRQAKEQNQKLSNIIRFYQS
ncbi:RNA binding protein [gamma proteobacterium IMCC2047]|nr:RNA binding protein [gamma proteobacterium IMCC2047]